MMKLFDFVDRREHRVDQISSDIVVVGGGLSGVCAAIAAAREGATVSLIQDRPVLGGNASSEIRVWVLGATSHMGNNNRWSREGGIIDEILLENLYRNREGNPLFFDMVVMDKVLSESNITLYLNTIAYDVEKSDKRNISKVFAFNPQNSTHYEFSAKLFVDASGDGVVGFKAGASHRVGSELSEDYGELFSPTEEYGEMLGHSIFFYTKECKDIVEYHAPDFAIKAAEAESLIPKLTNPNYFNVKQHGCKYWWLEYGGRLDTIEDTEKIKYELWRVVYGVWDYIKNSGKFPETANQTLEWVAAISGKRESRRFNGAYSLIQQDIIEQRSHYDAVAYGGWSIDLHPADAVFSVLNGCNQWHSKGVYQIPYRCYVGNDIDNMFLCGRNISASHVAHASTRVMCTAAHGGQAVGVAAALCIKNNLLPKDYIAEDKIKEVQRVLISKGQFIPGLNIDIENKLYSAELSTSSTFVWDSLPATTYLPISDSVAQLIPLKGEIPTVEFRAKADSPTELTVELRGSTKSGNFTPDIVIESKTITIERGKKSYKVEFNYSNESSEYLFITFMKNESVELAYSDLRISGTCTVYNSVNPAVSNYGKQTPPDNIGVEPFEFWCPKRWNNDYNVALSFSPALDSFGVQNLTANTDFRPTSGSNCWVAAIGDNTPSLTLTWNEQQQISAVTLMFDTDANQALENNQMGHLRNRIPQCVESLTIENNEGVELARVENNHLTCRKIAVSTTTKSITIKLGANSEALTAIQGIIIE